MYVLPMMRSDTEYLFIIPLILLTISRLKLYFKKFFFFFYFNLNRYYKVEETSVAKKVSVEGMVMPESAPPPPPSTSHDRVTCPKHYQLCVVAS